MPLVAGESRSCQGEGPRNAGSQPLYFPQRQQCGIWIREWSWNQPVNQPFTCWGTLGKLFNYFECQFFRSKNETICFLKWLLWWIHAMTSEKDSSTQHTFLPCVENPECHFMHRENRVTKNSSNKWEFILVTMSNTGNICGHNIPHFWIIRERKFLVQVIPRNFLAVSPREKALGDSPFFIKRLEMRALVSSYLIKQRHWGWGSHCFSLFTGVGTCLKHCTTGGREAGSWLLHVTCRGQECRSVVYLRQAGQVLT